MSDYFKDIRNIIEKGFIVESFKINDVIIKIKNPNLQIIEWTEEFSSQNIERSVALLTKLIISISGRETKDFFYEVFETLMDSQIFSILSKMYVYAHRLMNRAIHANKYLEAYCYTDESRYLWKAWKSRSLFTTHRLEDLNNIQISWVIWNEAEDERIESDRDWEKAFFIASATNPKGVEAVQKKWRIKDNQELERREDLIDQAVKGLFEETEGVEIKKKTRIKKQKTMQDLEEEMRKWVSGEEDDHDVIVRTYKEDIQNHIDELVRQAEEIKKQNKKKRAELDSAITGISLVGLTEEQIRSKVKPQDIAAPNINDVNRNIIDSFIMKPTQGNLSVDGDKVVVNQPSLMDKIAQRKPTME